MIGRIAQASSFPGRPLSGYRLAAILLQVAMLVWSGTAAAAGSGKPPDNRDWSFEGVFGTIDRGAAQRGFQVYREVCASCHALKYVAFRHLEGIGLDATQIAALASEYDITDGPDEFGEDFSRPGRASDFLPSPFANEEAARAANGGALPPDLSLLASARASRMGHNGADYIYALLTGYDQEPPADLVLAEGAAYNPYFAGGGISMANPLFEDAVTYADGTAASVAQMASDVAVFLTWAADPHAGARKALGFKVILFLLVMTGIFYLAKRRVWSRMH